MNNYKKLYVILTLLFSPYLYAQTDFVVVDSLTKKELPFVHVFYNNTGDYTNNQGRFSLNKEEIKKIKVEYLGYETKNIFTKNIKDTIYLKKENIKLSPVILQGEKKKIEILSNKKTRNFPSQPLSPKTTLYSVLIPKKEYQDRKLEEITLRFEKDHYSKSRKRYKRNNVSAILRIHIYNQENGNLKTAIYNSDIYEVKLFKKEEINIDLTEEEVYFEKEGIAIEVEVIKFISEKSSSKEIAKTYLRVSLTDEENQFFTAETFLKSTFEKENYITPINEIFNHDQKRKYYKRNLRIGMILK